MYAACDELERKGVSFRKKPDEGRMKGLAFATDPVRANARGRGSCCAIHCLSGLAPQDGYWIEIIRRPTSSPMAGKGFSYNQTMIRCAASAAAQRRRHRLVTSPRRGRASQHQGPRAQRALLP